MEAPRNPEQSREGRDAVLDDLYTKLEDRDAKITALEVDRRADAATIESEANIKKGLQAQVDQYEAEIREKSRALLESEVNLATAKTSHANVVKRLEKDHKTAVACFHDAQSEADALKMELDTAKAENLALRKTIVGAQQEFQEMLDKQAEYQHNLSIFQEAKDFADKVGEELSPMFRETGRQLNATNVLSHIHELQEMARQPRRKSERKVSMADELAGHSDDGGSEYGGSVMSHPAGDHVDDDDDVHSLLTGEAQQEALSQDEELNASVDREAAEKARLETVDRQQTMAEILARNQSDDDLSPPSPPAPTLDWEEAYNDVSQRYQEAEAELEKQVARNKVLEEAESLRVKNTIKADRAAAVEKLRQQEREQKEKSTTSQQVSIEKARIAELDATDNVRIDAEKRKVAAAKILASEQEARDASEKIRLIEEVKTLKTQVTNLQSLVDAQKIDAEKVRLNEMIKTRDATIEKLQDQVDALPIHRRWNQALQQQMEDAEIEAADALQRKDNEHAASIKDKDARVAEWQQCINEIQSNSLLVGPLELNPVYVDVVRDKTTREWLRDMPWWWQSLLFLVILFLLLGNYSAWTERHAWVTSNVFAMNHVRDMAAQEFRSSSFFRIWLEDFIGFDRRYWG